MRRGAVVAMPLLVPVTMSAAFAGLPRLLRPRDGYRAAFGLYWAGWGAAFPLWVLGPREAVRLLAGARRLRPAELLLVLAPAAGAVVTELLPRRRLIAPRLAGAMIGMAVLVAVTEELLWRGAPLAVLPADRLRGTVLPLLGFAAWHLAPQLVLPSARGRLRFVAGAALVGAVSTVLVRRTGGLAAAVVGHVLTDACGVRAARFRAGLPLD